MVMQTEAHQSWLKGIHKHTSRCSGLRGLVLCALRFAFCVLLILPGTLQAQTDERCFAETGHCISGRIRTFWEQNGGLAVFGLPISPQQPEAVEGTPRQVQWFERGRLELHPQNAPPFDVLMGRLGVDRLEQQQRDWTSFARSQPQEGCRFFAETGHNVCGDILTAWRASGLELNRQAGKSIDENLALFGLPLSEAQTERMADGQERTVQWFERARFELHPTNSPPYNVLLGLLGNELRGIETAPAPVVTARFQPDACPFGVPGDMRIECGYLSVLEDRNNPAGRTIQLAVAIVRASGTNPAPDPLVYLSGGPGSPALPSTISFVRGWASFIGNRDFIVVDQRGTGFSRPALTCPEVIQANRDMQGRQVSRAEKVQAEAEALVSCRNRLVSEGVNPAAYTSAASAADLEDLRVTLGYARWNLIGISYGTRLALTAMRDYPDGIRSAILDSTYPLEVNLHTEMPANADRAFKTLFKGCAANSGCTARYPDLEQVFYALVDRLNANPISVGVPDASTGGTIDTVIDGNRLVGLIYSSLYTTSIIPQLPKMIYDTWNGNYAMLANMEARRLGRQGGFSHGMYFSVQCSEEISFTNLDEVNAGLSAFPRLSTFFSGIMENTSTIFSLCAAWGINPPDPRENQPVQSSVPALILGGEYDPVTPPEWGRMVARSLEAGYFYQFPGTGHAVVTRGACPYGMIRAFLANPSTPPDGACATTLGGPPF